jgi:hypothetical protein
VLHHSFFSLVRIIKELNKTDVASCTVWVSPTTLLIYCQLTLGLFFFVIRFHWCVNIATYLCDGHDTPFCNLSSIFSMRYIVICFSNGI